jgi:hypothetical protein
MSAISDIRRVAAFMVNHFGEEAHYQAGARATKHLACGDLTEVRIWLRVLRAIDLPPLRWSRT